MWETRNESLAALNNALKAEGDFISEAFAIVDEGISNLEKNIHTSEFMRVSCITAVKGRQLGFACFSLLLDGCGQETGALLRPMLECNELLAYLRIVPEGSAQALNGKLPPAGVRAMKISGNFKFLREYLNTHASHFAFTPESYLHLVNSTTGTMNIRQPFLKEPLRTNLGYLHALLMDLARQTAVSLQHAGLMPVTAESFNNKILLRLNAGLKHFFGESLQDMVTRRSETR